MTESEFEDYAAVIRSGQMPQERVPGFLAENREPNPVDCSHGVAMDVFCEKCEPRSQPVTAAAKEALRLLGAEDDRQTKLHEILETIREQIRLGVPPEHRPDGLFQNIQNAVYAMRGRTALLNDAAIVAPLAAAPAQSGVQSHDDTAELVARLYGRALFLRKRGGVKSPDLMERAAAALSVSSAEGK